MDEVLVVAIDAGEAAHEAVARDHRQSREQPLGRGHAHLDPVQVTPAPAEHLAVDEAPTGLELRPRQRRALLQVEGGLQPEEVA